jgi:beta-phosphoglucomutase family hydrolase
MIDYKQFAFIFDMDGTLVDNMHFHADAWVEFFNELGMKVEADDFLRKTAGKTGLEIFRGIFGETIAEEQLIEYGNRKDEIYRENFLPNRKPVAGLIAFLDESKRLGIKMAVATAAPISNMEFILDGLDLRKYFDAITTAADVKNGKPDPEVFLVSAEKLRVLPRNSIVFEDAISGFEAAHRAGMKSVGIATVNSIEDMLKLDSVVEAQNDFLGLNPQEIIERYVPLFARVN